MFEQSLSYSGRHTPLSQQGSTRLAQIMELQVRQTDTLPDLLPFLGAEPVDEEPFLSVWERNGSMTNGHVYILSTRMSPTKKQAHLSGYACLTYE